MANFQRLDGYVSGMPTSSGGSGRNRIDASNDAEIKRRTRGYDTAIIDARFYTGDTNSNNMWKLTATTVNNILIGAGVATCYGYDLVSKAETLLTATAPASGTKYIYVYLSWDLSPLDDEIVGIGIHDNGANPTWSPTFNDNLSTIPNGKYQLPLYRLTVNTLGTIIATQSWLTLGVETKRGVEWAKNAAFSSQVIVDANISNGTTEIVNAQTLRNWTSFKYGSIVIQNSAYIEPSSSFIGGQVDTVIGKFTLKAPSQNYSSNSNVIINIASFFGLINNSQTISLFSESQKINWDYGYSERIITYYVDAGGILKANIYIKVIQGVTFDAFTRVAVFSYNNKRNIYLGK